MGRGRGRGGGGPIGKLASLVGQGVGLAQEYREHRKELKDSRASSQNDINAASRETSHSSAAQAGPSSLEAPPPYVEATPGYEQRLQSGPPRNLDSKKAKSPEGEISDENDDDDSLVDDEEDWELDEAAGLPSFEDVEREDQNTSVDELVRDTLRDYHPLPLPGTSIDGSIMARQPLPCPVVIPQRRPRNNVRGFVRAYAPVLANCGIDQETFLKFLKNFHQSSQASPIFPMIQIAAGIAGLAPSVIAMAVTTAAQVAARVGEEMQVRVRTNNFLDRMNNDLFRPAGLYALIIKYKSDADMQESAQGRRGLASLIQPSRVDITTNQSIAKHATTDSSEKSFSDRMKKLRLASGTTYGSIAMPEAAPLVYPAIDYQLSHNGPETFKDKKRDAGKFLADYLDRRAQAQYAREDPNSVLAQQQQPQAAKQSYADPNHPMYSGGLISLISGGKINLHAARQDRREGFGGPSGRRGGRRARRRDYGDFDEPYYQDGDQAFSGDHSEHFGGHSRGGSSGRDFSGRRGGRRQGRTGALGTVKRMMKKDVLYLLIVNLPSEAELQAARRELAMADGGS